MGFVEQHNGPALSTRHLLGVDPKSLPKTRQGRFGPICGDAERLLSEPIKQFKKQGRLAHLTGSRKELNPRWGGFSQSAEKQVEALPKTEPVMNCNHTRISIRL